MLTQAPAHAAVRQSKRYLAAFAVAGIAAGALAACGGGGTAAAVVDMPVADGQIGQADFAHSGANHSSNTVSKSGFGTSNGGIATDGVKFYMVDSSHNRILGWNSPVPTTDRQADFIIGQSSDSGTAPGSGSTQLSSPRSVFISDDGKLVVADSGNNRVLIWDTLPTSNIAPSKVFGDGTSTVSGTSLSFPVSAVIAQGKLLVSDQSNNRVLVWKTYATEVGMPADVVLGQALATTNTPGNNQNGMTQPAGLWSDGFQLLVSDSSNNRVLYWTQIPSLNNANASYVIGQATFAGTTFNSSATSLHTPLGISSDGTAIFVADAGNNRVLRYDSFPVSNGLAAAQAYGQDNLTNHTANDDNQDGVSDTETGVNGTIPTARTFDNPQGVTVTPDGTLYATDTNNFRIMIFAGN